MAGLIGVVHPALPAQAVPAVRDVEGAEGQGERVQIARVGLPGHVPRCDPSYVQKDKEIIAGLGLNLKHVVAGAEPAQVARWTSLYKQKKPVLFYWYTPQYLNVQYDLAKVALPVRTKTCAQTTPREASPPRRRTHVTIRRTVLDKLDQQQVREERLAYLSRSSRSSSGRTKDQNTVAQHDHRQEDEAGQGGRGLGEGEPG